MVDTTRVLTDLQTLLADNSTRAISAQDLRDFLVSAVPSGRTPNFTVAASGATAVQKAQADYVCNGTADEVTIETAIAALPAAGGTVYLTDGTFDLDATIDITTSGVRLIGSGYGTTITSTELTTPVILVTGGNVELADFRVGHTSPLVRDAGSDAIRVTGADNPHIHDVEIFASAATAIFIGAVCTNVRVHDNYFHDTLADGIHITGASLRVNVSNNTGHTTGDDGIAVVSYVGDSDFCREVTISGNNLWQCSARLITVDGGEQITITGNTCRASDLHGILVDSGVRRASRYITITGNTVRDANTYDSPTGTGFGIAIMGGVVANPTEHITVANNVVIGGAEKMLRVGSGTTDDVASIRHITVIGNTLAGPNSDKAGLSVANATDVSVIGNHVVDAFNHGIHIESTAAGNIIVANNAVHEANQSAVGTWYGIAIDVDVNTANVTVEGNTVQDDDSNTAADYGVLFAGTTYAGSTPVA